MADRAEELEKKAWRKLNSWGLFGNKYEDAAELFEKAGNCFKVQKSWDRAGECFINQASTLLKNEGESRFEAATAYVEAGKCYMKNKTQDAANAFKEAAKLFMEAGRLTNAAKNFKDIAEIYEKTENLEEAATYFAKAGEIYAGEEQTSAADQCNLKVAQYAAQTEDYPRAIEIYESIARRSLDNNLLKYSVKNHLLSAGLCHLCREDVVAIQNALEKYEDLDPTFSNTREFRFLKDLAEAVEELDVTKFTDVVKEFDSMTRLDTWKTTMLLRAKKNLKAKEDEEDDLT